MTMPRYPEAVERWRPLVEKYFPPHLVDKALYVIQYESGGQSIMQHGGGPGTGLFQVEHGGAHPGRLSAAQLLDPETNIRTAAQMASKNWDKWTDWGEGTTYQGKAFGALGNHPYQAPQPLNQLPVSPPAPLATSPPAIPAGPFNAGNNIPAIGAPQAAAGGSPGIPNEWREPTTASGAAEWRAPSTSTPPPAREEGRGLLGDIGAALASVPNAVIDTFRPTVASAQEPPVTNQERDKFGQPIVPGAPTAPAQIPPPAPGAAPSGADQAPPGFTLVGPGLARKLDPETKEFIYAKYTPPGLKDLLGAEIPSGWASAGTLPQPNAERTAAESAKNIKINNTTGKAYVVDNQGNIVRPAPDFDEKPAGAAAKISPYEAMVQGRANVKNILDKGSGAPGTPPPAIPGTPPPAVNPLDGVAQAAPQAGAPYRPTSNPAAPQENQVYDSTLQKFVTTSILTPEEGARVDDKGVAHSGGRMTLDPGWANTVLQTAGVMPSGDREKDMGAATKLDLDRQQMFADGLDPLQAQNAFDAMYRGTTSQERARSQQLAGDLLLQGKGTAPYKAGAPMSLAEMAAMLRPDMDDPYTQFQAEGATNVAGARKPRPGSAQMPANPGPWTQANFGPRPTWPASGGQPPKRDPSTATVLPNGNYAGWDMGDYARAGIQPSQDQQKSAWTMADYGRGVTLGNLARTGGLLTDPNYQDITSQVRNAPDRGLEGILASLGLGEVPRSDNPQGVPAPRIKLPEVAGSGDATGMALSNAYRDAGSDAEMANYGRSAGIRGLSALSLTDPAAYRAQVHALAGAPDAGVGDLLRQYGLLPTPAPQMMAAGGTGIAGDEEEQQQAPQGYFPGGIGSGFTTANPVGMYPLNPATLQPTGAPPQAIAGEAGPESIKVSPLTEPPGPKPTFGMDEMELRAANRESGGGGYGSRMGTPAPTRSERFWQDPQIASRAQMGPNPWYGAKPDVSRDMAYTPGAIFNMAKARNAAENILGYSTYNGGGAMSQLINAMQSDPQYWENVPNFRAGYGGTHMQADGGMNVAGAPMPAPMPMQPMAPPMPPPTPFAQLLETLMTPKNQGGSRTPMRPVGASMMGGM